MAVRLRTESALCHVELSVKASACSAALRVRYSCSMYSGYRPCTFTEAFLRATPTPGPTCFPLRAPIVDTAREAVHRRTVRSSKVALIFRRWHSVERKDGQREIFFCCLVPSSCSSKWCCEQTELQPGCIYRGQLPFDDPWPSSGMWPAPLITRAHHRGWEGKREGEREWERGGGGNI